MFNRNHWKALAFLAIPLAITLRVGTSWAEPPHPGTPGSGQCSAGDPGQANARLEGAVYRLIHELSLTPQQADTAKSLLEQGKRESQALRGEVDQKRKALMVYLRTPDANQAKAQSMHREISTLEERLSDLRLKVWFAVRAELTPEQLQKLSQLPRPGATPPMQNQLSPGGPHHPGPGEPPPAGMPGTFGPGQPSSDMPALPPQDNGPGS